MGRIYLRRRPLPFTIVGGMLGGYEAYSHVIFYHTSLFIQRLELRDGRRQMVAIGADDKLRVYEQS